jgi:hypothetical protein
MIRKHAFACLMLISSLTGVVPAFAATPVNGSSTDTTLSAMETKIFSHSYIRESEADRVARLERFVFSSTNNGTLDERVSRLTSAVNIRDVKDDSYVPKRRPFTDWTPSANKPAAPAAPVVSNANYPRVNELEQRLFGQTYSNEPVATRLNRLEIRAYGKPSSNSDLAMRVDNLISTVVPRPSLAPVRLASYQPSASRAGDYQNNFFGLTRSASTADRPTVSYASGVRGTQCYTVVDQIEYLENATFGKIRPNKTLQKRVGALEEKFYGAQKTESDKDLTSRVAQLWHVANTGIRNNTVLNTGA